MPNPSGALVAFGKLVAFLDDSGEVQFAWLGDPLDKSLAEMPANRARLHELMQALIHPQPTGQQPVFALDGMVWEPVNLGSAIGVGFAWNTGGQADPLRLGLGAAASFSFASQTIDLAVLARLIKIHNGDLVAELPSFAFGGTIPVPDFLQSATLAGEVPSPTQVNLTVNADATDSRTLSLPGDHLAWDSARVAVFILQAWVRSQTTGGDTFFDRLDRHLFPMFGDPPGGPIAAFPLFGAENMGQEAKFDAWVDSVATLDDNAQGALTFLWHLRALLTGNDSSSFLDGSYYFPLEAGPSGGGPPTVSDLAGTLSDDSPGAFVGVEQDPQDSGNLRLVIRLQNEQSRVTIPLAKNSGGSLTRPVLTDDPSGIGTPAFPLPTGMSANGTNPTRLTILKETLPVSSGFGGAFKADLLLTQGEAVGYEIQLPTSPALGLTFPQNGGGPFPSPQKAFADVLALVTGAAEGTAAEQLLSALQSVVAAAVQNQAPDAQAVLGAILLAAGDQDADALEIGDVLSFDLEPGAVIKTGLDFGKVADAFEKSPVRIGKAGLDAKFALLNGNQPLQSVKLRLQDLRIDPSSKVAGGVAGSLLGDLTEAPGFNLNVEWKPGPPAEVIPSGGGRFPIQQTIGPLELSTLYVEVDKTALEIALDAAFSMGPVTVTPYELGIRIPFSDGASTIFLRGLGLAMDAGGIKLAGHFAEVDNDYVGAAVVSVVDFFELSAIGGYTKLDDGSDSLFIFASLVAPLGGPPFLFVTGVAGGFGYNRLLPPPGPISENPFMRVMRGEIALGGGPSDSLKKLGKEFLPSKGQYWIAAGLQFVSFGFIHGKLVVVIGFPNFSLQILGSAAFGISPVAYFEIELQATADDEVFELIAGLSHNSYVIHPDIFSLHGQFGLATWHGGEHAGDFVFSIGGYHSVYRVPEHYPKLERVGVKATVYGFVKLSVECYFATTPQAMMAGASISLSAEFAGIAAGLDVYVDVYIQWDPFFIQGRMGVVVWFEFMGRHEIGVHLEIHTPPLGGVATIDLALVSFDIEFGKKLGPTPRPSILQFVENQLGVEADPWNGEGARVAALSTSDRAGLFRLDMLWGRTAIPEHETDAQEGTSASAPIRVGAEFAFSVRSRLPVGAVTALIGPHPQDTVSIGSSIDLALCQNADDLGCKLKVTGTEIHRARLELLDDAFPAAQFGVEVEAVQADSYAKALIGQVKTDEAVVDLTEGIEVAYLPKFDPAEAKDWDIVATEEPSMGEELYPLPLGAPSRTLSVRTPKAQLILGQGGGWTFKAPGRRPLKLKRAAAVRQRIEARVAKPLELAVRGAAIDRPTRLAPLAGPGFATRPANAPVVEPPASPVRRLEMWDIGLTRIEPRLPATPRPAVRSHLGVSRTQVSARTRPELRRVGSREQAQVQVQTGSAALVEMIGDRPARGAMTLRGAQFVRAIFLGAQGQPVADEYLPAGFSGPLPPRSRQVVFFGEGADAPVASAAGIAGSAARRAVAAIGVEQDTTLTALSPRTFAAQGCVVEALSSYPDPVEPLDTLPGYDLLRAIPILRLHFPAVPPNGTLVLHCEPVGGEAGPAAEQIRWRSLDAELGSLRIVNGPERVALTMTVAADEPWIVEVDLGADWRLSGAAWRPQQQRATLAWLAASASWDMIDDRRTETPRAVTTSVDLEFEA